METTYGERVSELERRLQGDNGTRVNCFPTALIAAILTPIIIWAILYFAQPNFVRRKEGSASFQDNSKVLVWTLIISALIIGAGWIISSMWGYNFLNLMCMVS